ncbi:unnamed protein product [Mytilus edulis]|uniref:B box-type domain-containing protein n=1 Tax=Mytilus edulis TaxID=6550 RepID=A0A8S3PTE3_MYTED|nr:unnamed protein product [Mytilus edulis]
MAVTTKSNTNFCTLCQDDGTPNEAVRWCTECEVFLCRDCEKHHRKSRMFQNHKTMSINEYINLPAFVQKISSQCRDHKKKFELYCSFHACPCCVQCITDTHKKCQDMKPLSDILKQVKVSASVQLLEKDLKDLKENFEKIIIYLKTRINTNTIQNKKAVVEIRSMRKSINDYLNTLEKEILDDLESKHQKLKSEINIILEQMEQQANQIGHFQNQFSKMTKHATELQIYVGLREIENTTSKAAKYIDDLEKGGQLNEKKLEVSISPVLRSVLEDVKSFGDVHMRTASSTLRLNAGRKDQAQYLLPQVSGIDKIKPSFLRKITIAQNMKPINHIYMATSMILPNGRFLILDNIGKRILLFSNEGMFIRDVVTLTGDPEDVCFVKDHTVAVTLGSTQQTVVVDVKK